MSGATGEEDTEEDDTGEDDTGEDRKKYAGINYRKLQLELRQLNNNRRLTSQHWISRMALPPLAGAYQTETQIAQRGTVSFKMN
jgi:hypothetical protein